MPRKILPDSPRKILGSLVWLPVTVMSPRKRYRFRSPKPTTRLGRLLRRIERNVRRLLRLLAPTDRRASAATGVPVTGSSISTARADSDTDHRQRYGLIVYEGAFYNNIGDEIQSLAAMRFLPSIDYLIPIDKLTALAEPEPGSPKVKVIMNGYFTCLPEVWPPPDWIEPLFVSFHLTDIPYHHPGGRGNGRPMAAAEVLLSGRNLEYFKRHEPIGCRDQATVDRFKSAGVEAYFTGCMTLTLQSNWHRSRDKIYIVDVACDVSKLIDSIPRHLRDSIVVVTHDLNGPESMSQIERFASAQELLMMYRSARVVVTSRLHCALPSLAVGTSVLFVKPQVDVNRFGGLEGLLNCVTFQDIAEGRIDWDDPPPNPTRHVILAEQLSEACRVFVSEERDASFIPESGERRR